MDKKFKKLTVLFVEDDTFIRDKISLVLKKLLKEIYVAKDEFQAISLYKENKNSIDLVLCSMNNSNKGIIELLKQIRQYDKELFFIIMSEKFEVNDLLEAIKYNLTSTLSKPIIIKELLISIYNTCEKKFKENKTFVNEDEVQNYLEALNKVAIVSKTDLKGIITEVNDIFCEIAQYSREELIGKPHNIVRHPDMPKQAFEELWKHLKAGNKWQGKVKNKAKDGSEYFVNATIAPLYDNKNENITGYIGIRFLTTDDENEKREFKKKVIVNLKNTKKREIELISKIQSLESILSSTNYLRNDLQYEQTKSSKLTNQINFYEKEISQTNERYNQMVTSFNAKIALISNAKTEVDEKNKKSIEIISLQQLKITENSETIEDLENKCSQLSRRVDDLKDVITHRESEIEELINK